MRTTGHGLRTTGHDLQMTSTVPLNFIRGRRKRSDALPRVPKPDWLKVRAPGSENYLRLKGLMRDLGLHTVCEEANCPNIGECWHHGTATFMILGGVCTRSCGYCNVTHGRPDSADPHEPVKVASAVHAMGLDYVVVTSVDRDDLPDGGAAHFAAAVRAVRAASPETLVEVLIPDFQGDASALAVLLASRPDVVAQTLETVERLTHPVRDPRAGYRQTLDLLARVKRMAPGTFTQSSLMLGLGEEWDEVVQTLRDLDEVGCRIVTIGQYLRPSLANMPMTRYYTPAEFAELKRIGLELGIGHVESGPLVRSSYHAHEQTAAYESSIAEGGMETVD